MSLLFWIISVFLLEVHYTQSLGFCRCGEKYSGTRIVGGVETEVNEYPWQALLLKNGKHICGGSLVSPKFVLTAAHCVIDQDINTLTIRLGEHEISNSDESSTQEFNLKRIFMHRRYDDATNNNDVALLRLNGTAAISDTVMPICLPINFQNSIKSGDTVTVTGWGTTSYLGFTTDVLNEVNVTYIPTEDCRSSSYRYGNRIKSKMFCAAASNKDSCQGDSGGPLVWLNPDNNLYFQYGVVSWGDGCAYSGAPGVYAKVVRFLPWITRRRGMNACVVLDAA